MVKNHGLIILTILTLAWGIDVFNTWLARLATAGRSIVRLRHTVIQRMFDGMIFVASDVGWWHCKCSLVI